jgi:hypothetical protein
MHTGAGKPSILFLLVTKILSIILCYLLLSDISISGSAFRNLTNKQYFTLERSKYE